MAPMDTAFVIQFHAGFGPDHYDLMIEAGETLATWRFADPPGGAAGPLPCERIADHRRAYLTYEGPVSGGRGTVRIVDRGTCDVTACTEDRWVVRFRGQALAGAFELLRDDEAESRWQLRPLRDFS